MKFRKLLAFVLVFSMATQPGGVRFGYAEDTKAAEVENKAEESDEIGIDLDEAELGEYLFNPGSREQDLEETASAESEKAAEKSTFSGAIVAAKAAVVTAVSAAVGTLGLMIYNAASNKGAIADVWTSDEGTFFSRIGKTISILFKGAKALDSGDNSQEIKQPSEEPEEPTENVENQQEGQSADDVKQQGSDPNQEEPASQETPESTPELSDDNKEEVAEQPAEEPVEPSEVKNDQNIENQQEGQLTGSGEQPTGSNSSSDDVKVEEKDEIFEITTESGSAGEDKQKLTDPKQQPKTDVTSQKNNKDNSRSENSTVVVTSESKEVFIGSATKNVFELTQRKNNLYNTLNKLNNTCGLAAAGLQGELNEIDLVEAEATAKLDEAEAKLNSIMTRLNALDGDCSAIKSDKDYIVANWETVVSILDSSDASLRNDFGTLKLQRVTEGNLETLAEDYKKIAGRVKAILDNNKAISTSTGKISTAIEGNKDLEWFDEAYYNGQLDEISNRAKTEKSLPGIKNEVEELLKELNDVKTANKLDGEINELIPEFGNYKLGYKTQYENDYKAKCAELKKEHDLSKVVNELETFKKDLEARLNNLKTFCKNNPAKCGK